MKQALTLLALLSLGRLAAQPYPHTDPQNAGGWVLDEAVSDEFDGDALDTEKWHIQGTDGIYQSKFIGRAPSQFSTRNVEVGDGSLKILTKWEPDFPFADREMDGHRFEKITTAAVITKATFLYGYLEIRCKAADGPITSAFWSTGKGGELDVFEHFGNNPNQPDHDRRCLTSFHDWRDPKSPVFGRSCWSNDHLLDFRVAEDFHTYAVEWDPNYLRIFVDGRQIRYVSREEIGDAWVLTDPQMIWLDSESFPWEVDPAKLTAADFPAEGLPYIVDYVRVWQHQGPGPATGPGTNLLANPSFEADADGWTLTGEAAVHDAHSAHLTGKARLEQAVTVKPNTTYVLSAWARLPGTNLKNVWQNAWLGVADYGGEELRRQFFRPDDTRLSLQFTTRPDARQIRVFFTNDASEHEAFAGRFELYEAPLLSALE